MNLKNFSLIKVFKNETEKIKPCISIFLKTMMDNLTEVDDYVFSEQYGLSEYDIERLIFVITTPPLIIFGSFGNILTFIVMRTGSLKDASTCFYMSVLAVTDTGKYEVVAC